jgi:hypothetical protein
MVRLRTILARRKVTLPAEDSAPLRAQFFAWLARRTGRSPLQAELWAGAVALAQRHGLCPVAWALGLDYASLKTKLARAWGQPGLIQPAFLELPATRSLAAGTTIEITAADAARMCIQLEAGQARGQVLDPGECLRFHQKYSVPIRKDLEGWLRGQVDEKRLEHASGLGRPSPTCSRTGSR